MPWDHGLWLEQLLKGGSTLILDMTLLTTAAEAIEMVHLADSLSASDTQRAFGSHV